MKIITSKFAAAFAAFWAFLMASMPAHAAIDVTAVVQEIRDTLTPIGAIGSAVLIVIVAIAAYSWIRRAMRG